MKTKQKAKQESVSQKNAPNSGEEPTGYPWPELPFPCGRISRQSKLAFGSACAAGLLTHLYVFTNLLLNHDSARELIFRTEYLNLGRWFLNFIEKISSEFQVPVVIGVVSIVALAFTAVLTVKVLKFESTFGILFTSCFIVTFPVVACTFSYLYVADAYFLALLLNAAAVYIAKENDKSPLHLALSVLLMALACGIYQAYICFAIGLFLFDCILRLFTDEKVSEIVKSGVRYCIVILLSLLLYYAVLKILLMVTGTSLASYQGFSSMSLENIPAFLRRIPLAYSIFFSKLFTLPVLSKFFAVVRDGFYLLFILEILYLTVRLKIYEKPEKLLLLTAGIVLIPLALNFVSVLGVDANIHMLMIYAFLLVFLLTLRFTELTARQLIIGRKAHWYIPFAVSGILSCLLIWSNFCVSNIGYLRLQISYESSFALANRIAARIEQVENYSPEIPVAFVGSPSDQIYGRAGNEFDAFRGMTGTNTKIFFNEINLRDRYYIADYIGIRLPAPSEEQKEMLRQSGMLEKMPSYPAEGSVALYNGVIVVKMGEGNVH